MLDLDALADQLAERVWERFDIDILDFEEWGEIDPATLASIDPETNPEGYARLLVVFFSKLATPAALREAAALSKVGESK